MAMVGWACESHDGPNAGNGGQPAPNKWDEQLPHVELANNNSVSAATGLASNEVHMGTVPRLPRTMFEHTGVVGHQSLARDHLAYCDLATDRQQRAYDIVLWPPELGPRPPRLLRLGDRPPAASVRYRLRTPGPDS